MHLILNLNLNFDESIAYCLYHVSVNIIFNFDQVITYLKTVAANLNITMISFLKRHFIFKSDVLYYTYIIDICF